MTSLRLSGSALTTAALQQSDEDAFETLLSTMVKGSVPVSSFKRDAPVAVEQGQPQTLINVSVAKEHSPVNMWAYRDAQPITYNRVTMEAVGLKWGYWLPVDFPITHRELFSFILTRSGLFDRSEQIVDGVITGPGSVFLEALPDSFMLTGGYTFTVRQAVKNFSDVVVNTTLDVFDPASDMQGSNRTVLVNNVNELNAATLPRPIRDDEIHLSDIVVLNDYDEINTEVKMAASGSIVYSGSVLLQYHRVNFSWLLNGEQMLLTGPSNVTTPILLNLIRNKTGFNITLQDLVTETYPRVPVGTTTTLTVFISSSSLGYVGEITIDYTAE